MCHRLGAGHVHQRRSDRSPVGEGSRPARAGTVRPGHLSRLRRPDGFPRPRWRAADHLVRRPVHVRGVEAVFTESAMRLQRPDLRDAARTRRDPVAVHGGGTGRNGASLHRRHVQYEPGLLRNVRPGPAHRCGAHAAGVPRHTTGWAGLPACHTLPPSRRGQPGRVPVRAHHRPEHLPFPHPDEDRPSAAATAGGAGRLDRDVPAGRRPIWNCRWRPRAGRVCAGST